MAKLFVVFWLCLALADFINGHGYLKDPVSRSAVMNPVANGTNCNNGEFNDTPQGNFCGGRPVQEANGGQCGACGDNYATSYPRPHDYGGKYATAITPTRIYLEGQEIVVVVQMTASHLGTFKFKLCSLLESDFPGEDVLTECFNDTEQYILLTDDYGDDEFGGITTSGLYTYTLRLPNGLTCPNGCSLQWWYETGNSPGAPFQEHFVNCADIKIVNCDQYTSGEYDMTSCGYGPTSEVYECEENSGGEGNGGESNGGDGNGGEGNGGESNGGESNGGESNGGSEGSESGDQGAGDDNCENGNSGFPAGSCAACTNAQSPTCSNECCSKETRDVYISSITDLPDLWCEEHCTMSSPFCPAKWCCKTTADHWVDECSSKKSLETVLERVDEKIKKMKMKKMKKTRMIKK